MIKEIIGYWLLFTAVIFFCIYLFGYDLGLKNLVILGVSCEIFVTLLVVEVFLLSNQKWKQIMDKYVEYLIAKDLVEIALVLVFVILVCICSKVRNKKNKNNIDKKLQDIQKNRKGD